MPIYIYESGTDGGDVAFLCGDTWSLPEQVEGLKNWMSSAQLDPGHFIADIGFMIRPDASGGGAVLEPEFLRALADAGVSLYLSEYR